MDVLSWFRDDELEPDLFHSSTLEGLLLSTRLQQLSGHSSAAMSHNSVFRGVQILTDITSSLPWAGMTGGEPSMSGLGQVREPDVLDPQPMLLLRPNPSQSRDQTIRDLVISMIWHGNAYLFLNGFDPETGRATMVEPLDPNRMSVTWNGDQTRRIFQYDQQTLELGFNLAWLPVNLLPGATIGLSPIFQTSESWRSGIEAERYGRELFAEGAVPTGALTVPGKLTKAEADKFRAQWEEQHANGRGTAILSGGMEYSMISLTPDQAQFILSKAWSAQQVARVLGIPQWFLNAGGPPGTASALTYTNLQQVFTELARMTLIPTYLRPIERVFSELLPRGQQVRFDLDEFLRADLSSRFGAYADALTAGFLTVEEVRIREKLPTQPIAGDLENEQVSTDVPI